MYKYIHTHTHKRARAHTPTHTHTHVYIHGRSHTRPHTHTQKLSPRGVAIFYQTDVKICRETKGKEPKGMGEGALVSSKLLCS